jgi:periplasmic divalent cation tolerance protein
VTISKNPEVCMTACLCYVTLGPREDACEIARLLVEERLAAAVNILDGVQSVYRWQDAIEEAPETMLVVKTRAELVERLTERVVGLHSYQCPAVVAVPVAGGNPGYLKWIEEQTG